MIEASFERGRERCAWATGAYQYDTGQRVTMHGLPSPQELAMEDDFLSGDMVTMQVHFGFKGDSQTQARLAIWNEERACWIAAIPDECLQAAESVYAYIYVSYGLDGDGNGRTKTMYELVFRPIARPAPNNVATSEQWEAWAIKQEELNLGTNALIAAQQQAQTAAQSALAAAQDADTAEQRLQEAMRAVQEASMRMDTIEQRWMKMDVQAIQLPTGEEATAQIQGNLLRLGLPRGMNGQKGENGDVGPADIAFLMNEGVLTITPQA